MNALDSWLAVAWWQAAVHLWQTTLVLGLFLAISFALGGAPASARDRLGWIGLAKFLVPFSLLGCSSRLAHIAEKVGDWSGFGLQEALRAGRSVTLLVPVRALAARGDSSASIAFRLATVLWLAGAITLVSVWLLRARRTRRGPGLPLGGAPARVREMVSEAMRETTVPASAVRILPGGTTPFVGGLVRPLIFLPWPAIRDLGPQELRGILLHEDEHRRRRDPLRYLVARVVIVLFFYYPPLWALLRRLRESGELACDEGARARGAPPESFADALAWVARRSIEPAGLPALRGGGGSLLRRRLEHLQRRSPNMRNRHRLILALAGAAALFALLAALLPGRVATASDADAEVVPPQLIHQVVPDYPAKAREAGQEGYVILAATIEKDGSVGRIAVEREDPLGWGFADSARKALEAWRFQAGTRGGEPAALEIKVPFAFRLEDKKEK
jgi:TonB family protein